MKNILILIIGLIISITASAQKMQTGNEITITKPVNHDLYLMGGTVNVNAPVYGDLIIGAGTVTINDTVNGDIMIAGGKVTINGYVHGDIRGCGGDINVNGAVQEDIVICAGNVVTSKSSVINGDAFLFAGTAIVSGSIMGNMTSKNGDLRLYGTVGQDADCRGDKIFINGTIKGKSLLAAREINIGEAAAFYQSVSYWQKNKVLDFKSSLKNGAALYDTSLGMSPKWYYIGLASGVFMAWYLASVFIFILLIQYAFGRFMKRAAEEAFNNSLRAVGRGGLLLIAIPVVAVLLMVTLVGLPLGILMIMFYFILLMMAGILSSVIIANWIDNRRNSHWGTGVISLVALAVFILLKLVSQLPFFGWLIMLVISCIVFGSLVTEVYNKRKKKLIPES